LNWAIGDIQGCFDNFMALLKKIEFDPKKDKLWLVGDLVNRGDKSLEVLEYLYSIKDSCNIVLGNHDISLIAAYYGIKKPNPSIEPIIKSQNAKELIDWLKSLPFIHIDYELGFIMAHAGIAPSFNVENAIYYNNLLQKRLSGKKVKSWLKEMFAKNIIKLDLDFDETDKERYALGAFTRMRYCYSDGTLDFKQKGPISSVKNLELMPWFDCPNKKPLGLKVVFGHWSTLGFLNRDDILAIDTGCVWHKELTAVRLEDEKVVKLSCK
jgi:bis(5'-nucleosyl)-tetraphosphatase (symmetrical)